MLGVGVSTLILGVPAGWYTAVCEFPGRRVFVRALLLPLAFPAYIIAYTYTGLLEYAGPVQTLLRDVTGWKYGDYWFFPIRSLGGAIAMLALVLYPYVYLLTRTAFLAGLIAVALALILGYAKRSGNTRPVRLSVDVSGLGYAIPGAIIAMGVIVPLAWLDHRLIEVVRFVSGEEAGLLLSGTVFALLFAYVARFLAVSLGAVQAGLEKIKPSLDYAARSLGRRPAEVLLQVHVPLLRSTVFTALLIVFVDVLEARRHERDTRDA